MASTSASAAKIRWKTRASGDPLLHEALGLLSDLRLPRLSPRSKTWEREIVATVGEDGVRIYLNKLAHGTRQDMLEAAEGAG